MMHATTMAGYYGKLPVRGDFIQRNLPGEFIQIWDTWLQTMIASSRNNLNEQWLDYYLVSPVWRYYLTLETGMSFSGIMLPSVDKVGRYFPFTLTTPLDQHLSANRYILKNKHWYDQAEKLALHALEENINFDQLNYETDTLNNYIQAYTETSPTHNSNFRVALNEQTNLEQAFSEITQHLPNNAGNDLLSYWWTGGNAQVDGNLICCNGLPDDNIYTAMLDGQWELCHLQQLNQAVTIPDSFDDLI